MAKLCPLLGIGLLVLFGLPGSIDSSVAHAQTARLPSRWQGLSLGEALERLRTAGLQLVYSDELVPVDRVVLDEPTATSPRGILEQLLAESGLAVQQGPGGRLLIVRAAPAPTGVLRGQIVHSGGVRLRTARILVPSVGARTSCDPDGRFELALPAGTYDVTVTAPGFVTRTFTDVAIATDPPTEVVWSVELLEIVHESIRVTGTRSTASTAPTGDAIGLDRELLDRAPNLLNDPYETIGRLPGVVESETTAALNVRGGRGDEILLLFDGLELYQPYHVRDLGGGLLTLLDSATIDRVDYFSGAFPAQYGNRVSSVLEMSTTTARGRPEGSLTLSRGLFRGMGQGEIGDGRGDWLVSVRAGSPEFLLDSWVSESVYDPSYFDLMGKAAYRVGSRTSVTAHVLMSVDANEDAAGSDADNVDTRYDSRYAWLTADTVWNADLLSRTLLAWGSSEVDRIVNGADSVGAVDDQRDFDFVELKQDWRAVPSIRHNLRFGFRLRWQDARYDYASVGAGSPPFEPPTRRTATPSGIEYSLYISDTFRIHPQVLFEFGLRYDAETYTGLDGDVTSPRANVAWSPNGRTTVRAGWGRYHQFQRIYELQIEDGVEHFFPVETAEHRQVVVEHQFGESLRGRISVFEKNQHGVRPWFENLFDPVVFVPEAQPDRVAVEPDRALSQGLESTLQGHTTFELGWSVSYTLSRIEDEFDGGTQPRLWDQRHAVDVGLQYSLHDRWWFATTGVWHSGRPTTAVTAGRGAAPDGSPLVVPILETRNAERYPSYLRIDARVERLLGAGRQRIRLFVNAANLLDATNVCCTTDFELVNAAGEPPRFVPDERQGLNRTFSLGVTWEFGGGSRER